MPRPKSKTRSKAAAKKASNSAGGARAYAAPSQPSTPKGCTHANVAAESLRKLRRSAKAVRQQVAEDAEHPVIDGQHHGHELADPVGGSVLGQLA